MGFDSIITNLNAISNPLSNLQKLFSVPKVMSSYSLFCLTNSSKPKYSIFSVLFFKTKKAANPYFLEAVTRECLTFLLLKMTWTINYQNSCWIILIQSVNQSANSNLIASLKTHHSLCVVELQKQNNAVFLYLKNYLWLSTGTSLHTLTSLRPKPSFCPLGKLFMSLTLISYSWYNLPLIQQKGRAAAAEYEKLLHKCFLQCSNEKRVWRGKSLVAWIWVFC